MLTSPIPRRSGCAPPSPRCSRPIIITPIQEQSGKLRVDLARLGFSELLQRVEGTITTKAVWARIPARPKATFFPPGGS